MHTLIDNKSPNHLWHYNLFLYFFIMVVSASPFMMLHITPKIEALFSTNFLITWITTYNLIVILSVVMLDMFTKANSKVLKYSIIANSVLLLFYPVIIAFNCVRFLRCSLYSLGILSAIIQGLIYNNVIPFIVSSKFSCKFSWPALLFSDLPSTLLYVLSMNSSINNAVGLNIVVCSTFTLISMLNFIIYGFFIRINKHKNHLPGSYSECKIIEDIVLNRTISNCSTNISELEYSSEAKGVCAYFDNLTDNIFIGWKFLLLVTVSVISSSIPIQVLASYASFPNILSYFVLFEGVTRILLLTTMLVYDNLALSIKNAAILSVFSLVYLTIPIALTFVTRYSGMFIYALLGLSSLVHSVIICGLFSNWSNLFPSNVSDAKKDSIFKAILLFCTFGYIVGNLIGYSLRRFKVE